MRFTSFQYDPFICNAHLARLLSIFENKLGTLNACNQEGEGLHGGSVVPLENPGIPPVTNNNIVQLLF